MPHPKRESVASLMTKEHYTPKEVSDLLEIDMWVIERACLDGALKAKVVDHHVLDINRADLLDWLDRWEHLGS
ncbi:MAG TPA: DNA-binding protein [Nitrolancea sp.]|jgi:hypothetical protein|nr:DNA-binding protein [Nitrolancea sp.]